MLVFPYSYLTKVSGGPPPGGISLVSGSIDTDTGTFTYDCPGGDLLIAIVSTTSRSSLNRSPANVTAVSWDGDPLSSIINTATGNGTTGARITAWQLVSPKAGSYSLAFSTSSGGTGQIHNSAIMVFCLSGVNTSSPIDTNNVGSPTATVTASAGQWTIGCGIAANSASVTISQVSSLTNIASQDTGSGSGSTGRYLEHSVDYLTTPGSNTVEYVQSSGHLRVGAFTVNPA